MEVDPEMLSGHLLADDSSGRRKIAVPAIFRRYLGDPTSAVRRLRRDGCELSEMLSNVPVTPTTDVLVQRIRVLNLLVAAGAAALLVVLGIYAVRHPHLGQ